MFTSSPSRRSTPPSAAWSARFFRARAGSRTLSTSPVVLLLLTQVHSSLVINRKWQWPQRHSELPRLRAGVCRRSSAAKGARKNRHRVRAQARDPPAAHCSYVIAAGPWVTPGRVSTGKTPRWCCREPGRRWSGHGRCGERSLGWENSGGGAGPALTGPKAAGRILCNVCTDSEWGVNIALMCCELTCKSTP